MTVSLQSLTCERPSPLTKAPNAMSASIHTGIEWCWLRRWRVLAAGLILLLLGGFVVRNYISTSPSSHPARRGDPRLDYAGPFRNIHPSIRYVGDARCTDCHE